MGAEEISSAPPRLCTSAFCLLPSAFCLLPSAPPPFAPPPLGSFRYLNVVIFLNRIQPPLLLLPFASPV